MNTLSSLVVREQVADHLERARKRRLGPYFAGRALKPNVKGVMGQ
jgi:hypothetical protein